METQQRAYAVEGVDEDEEAMEPADKRKRKKGNDEARKKQKRDKNNTSVYVTGLPTDASMDELKTYFGKCGIIMTDLKSGKLKIKVCCLRKVLRANADTFAMPLIDVQGRSRKQQG